MQTSDRNRIITIFLVHRRENPSRFRSRNEGILIETSFFFFLFYSFSFFFPSVRNESHQLNGARSTNQGGRGKSGINYFSVRDSLWPGAMIPLKISEVRKSLAEDLKFKSAPVKRAGWAISPSSLSLSVSPLAPLSRFYGASNARNAACECTRLKFADDIFSTVRSPCH